jgi:hypothetical protein
VSRGLFVAWLAGIILALGVGTPAAADPAGPTDYRSEVVAIEPPTESVSLEVIGGDSFLQLEARPGAEVFVLGYQGERYLWFRPDGAVLENRSAPSTYINAARYGGGDIPPEASPDAEPDWHQVGDGHRWAWHDHRIHWMQRSRPLGRSAGDRILESVVPLEVDGSAVAITVTSTWQQPPSAAPMWLGGLAGVATVAGSWALRGRRSRMLLDVPPAVLALVVGAWQFLSLPSETGPRLVWWVLPAIATACAVVAVAAGLQGRVFAARAATVLVGVELSIWGWIRSDGLTAAIIPTGAPGWLDRFSVALAIVAGLGLAVLMLWELFWPPERDRPRTGTSVPATRDPAAASSGSTPRSAVPGS